MNQSRPTAVSSLWHWLFLALLSQLGWGAYPVFLRYLQTVSQIPGLALLAVGNGVVFILVVIVRWRHLDWSLFRQPLLWLFGLFVVLRGFTNLLATRYTLAIYAQLIYLMTPFTVALLSRLVLRERLPRHTFKVLTLCLGGAVMMMAGELGEVGPETAVSRNDSLGIALAIASSFFLAFYMLTARRTTKYNISGESALIVHLVALSLFASVGSIMTGEDWQRWGSLAMIDWLVFGLFSFGVILGANLGQIRAVQQLGAPLVSTMMASRLISALLFAGLLLQERLSSIWQIIGAGLVFVTLTWYLRQRNRSAGHVYR